MRVIVLTDEYAAAMAGLQAELAAGRLHVALSRTSRAFVGASLTYVPKEFKATARLHQSEEDDNHTDTAAATPPASSEESTLRRRGGAEIATVRATAGTRAVVNRDALTADPPTPPAPLSWFGGNAAPQLFSAASNFEGAVRLAERAVRARAALLSLLSSSK